MATSKKTAKTLIRKKLRSIDKLDNAEKYELLSLYKVGTAHKELAQKFKITEESSKQFIHKEFSAFTNAHETSALITSELCHDPLKRSRDINSEFLRLIKEDGAAEAYTYFFARTGDNRIALKESGLDVGIIKAKGQHDDSVLSAYRLRGIYLRSLPYVAKEIDRIREDQLRDNPVTKPYVQSLLVEQVQDMKEVVINDARNRGNLLKAIDMLGKTIGAFTDRVEIHEVDPDSALDTLIELTKSEITSTYEVVSDD